MSQQYSIDGKAEIAKRINVNLVAKNSADATSQALDSATKALIARKKSGEIPYPYASTYLEDPAVLFDRIRDSKYDLVPGNKSYKLYSYYPEDPTLYLPAKFRGEYTTVGTVLETHRTVDRLTDIFVEDIRLRTRRFHDDKSVMEMWETDDSFAYKVFSKALTSKVPITPATLAETIRDESLAVKLFNITWLKGLLKVILGDRLEGKKWLDMSAGWGDRLITSMATNMEYLGYDPNTDLIDGHSRMIGMFGKDSGRSKHDQEVIYSGFEEYEVKSDYYDISLISPPFFDLEIYGNQEEQSINRYKDFQSWLTNFLFPSLKKIWDSLKVGGYLALNLGDQSTYLRVAAVTNLFIENMIPDSSYEGVVGIGSNIPGDVGYGIYRPVWVWKKEGDYKNRKLWNQTEGNLPRPIYRNYPETAREIVRSAISDLSPTTFSNAKEVADYLSKLGQTPPPNLSYVSTGLDDVFNITADTDLDPTEEYIRLYSDQTKEPPGYQNQADYSSRYRDDIVEKYNLDREKVDYIFDDPLYIYTLLSYYDYEDALTWGRSMYKLVTSS